MLKIVLLLENYTNLSIGVDVSFNFPLFLSFSTSVKWEKDTLGVVRTWEIEISPQKWFAGGILHNNFGANFFALKYKFCMLDFFQNDGFKRKI